MKRILSLAAAIVVIITSPSFAQQQPSAVPQMRDDVPHVVARAPSMRLAVIQGTAMRPVKDDAAMSAASAETVSDTGGLPNTTVRLRDIRYGRLVGTQVTDSTGAFMFRNVEPGSYLVELVGTNQTTTAATQLINANAGDIINAVVRQPHISAAAGQLPLASAIAQAIPAVVSVEPPASER